MFQLFSINLNKKSLYKLFQIKHLLPIHLLPPPQKKIKIIKLKKFLEGDVWRLRSPCNISKSKLNSWKKEEKDTVLILIATLATTEVSAGAVAKADQ